MKPKTVIRLFTAALFAAFMALAADYAVAETDAQWKPLAANKLSTCGPLWRAIGEPTDTNAAKRDTTFVCHARFVLSHDNVSKTPDWVVERLTKVQVSGKNDRPSQSFLPEKRVPPRGRATNADYTKTPGQFARGHMAPSEDFSQRTSWMRNSFVYSNVVPQVGVKFNSSIWAQLEDEVRKAARTRGEVYVITGPVRGDAATRSRTIAKADNVCGNEIVLKGLPDALV